MANPAVKGPGVLYVTSKIAATDVLDEEKYIKWYEDDHIAEIMHTSGIKSALRYKSIDPAADKPYLVTYPMDDIAFTQGEEFKNIKVHSDMLPNGGPIYDLADMDVRYYGLIQTYDPKGPTKEGQVKVILTAGIEPGDSTTDEKFDDWYRKEHLDELAKVSNYLRTTRFKLQYYRTNAQSRALKNLPARAADIAIREPPRFFAIHEFSSTELDMKGITASAETEWSKKIMGNAKIVEGGMWRLVNSFGDKKFFQ